VFAKVGSDLKCLKLRNSTRREPLDGTTGSNDHYIINKKDGASRGTHAAQARTLRERLRNFSGFKL